MPAERSGVLLSRWWSARRELQAQPLACFVIQPYPDISSLLQHVLIVKAAVARLDAANLQEKGVRKGWSWCDLCRFCFPPKCATSLRVPSTATPRTGLRVPRLSSSLDTDKGTSPMELDCTCLRQQCQQIEEQNDKAWSRSFFMILSMMFCLNFKRLAKKCSAACSTCPDRFCTTCPDMQFLVAVHVLTIYVCCWSSCSFALQPKMCLRNCRPPLPLFQSWSFVFCFACLDCVIH